MTGCREREWYAAKLLMECRVQDGQAEPDKRMYEESVVMFRAQSFAQAWQGAEEMGLRKQITGRNAYGQTIRWRLVKVLDVCPCLERGSECAEVYCRMMETPGDWDVSRVLERYYPEAAGARAEGRPPAGQESAPQEE